LANQKHYYPTKSLPETIKRTNFILFFSEKKRTKIQVQKSYKIWNSKLSNDDGIEFEIEPKMEYLVGINGARRKRNTEREIERTFGLTEIAVEIRALCLEISEQKQKPR
jgi:hypothetical protein